MGKAVQEGRGRRYRVAAARPAGRARESAPVYARQAENTELFHPDDWEQGEGFLVRERRDCRLYGWAAASSDMSASV